MEKNLDLRIQKTYLALHNAFTELLEQKPFDSITVNELCDKAMIRRTTFYKHFGDKYEYYTFYVKEIAESFRKEIPYEIMNTNINNYFIEMSSRLIMFLTENKKLMDNIHKSNMFFILLTILSEEIAKDFYFNAQKNNLEMTSIELENFADFYTGGLLNMLLQHYKKYNSFVENNFLFILKNVLS